jgi:UDP-glucose 4-epimerase
MEGRTPTIFGDGGQTRDWVDVSDVVQANLLAADSDISGPVNIGHGQETSVLQLVEALRAVSDRSLPQPEFALERAGEVRRSCLDVSRAREELGWEAKMPLAEGLRTILRGL